LGLWAKYMGLKQGATWNTLGEHIGNLRTHWALEGNIEGTKERCKKSSSTPSTQNLKEKTSKHLECMLPPTHWLHVCFISKTVGQHFWPRLMARERD
jgi:hypothetical protein